MKVEAIKVSMPFNEFDGKYDEPLPVGFSDTDIKEILAMSEQFVRSETQEIWVATAISILESSRVPSTVGSAVVTKVTRNYGVLAAIKTPFHQEDLGPIYFDHKSLLKIPVDMMEIMGIDELFVRQQLVDFKAVEMEPSVDSCKWLAISVAPSGEVIEAVGMICHYDDQKDFGFVAFLPKIADEKQQEVTLENISRKKNWDRSANSRQNYPFNFCNHLVYFHRTSVQFPIPKYPAATFNSFHQDYPTGSHTGENSVDQPLEDSSRNNVSKSFSLLKSFDSGYLSKSQEWVGKLVRFRACKEVGGKYWDWRATLVEVLEDRNDLNVDVKDAIKAPQISIFNWVERYARVEPHVKAAVVECVKLAENDSNIEFATQRSHSSSQVLTSMSFPIEEFLTNKLVELKVISIFV